MSASLGLMLVVLFLSSGCASTGKFMGKFVELGYGRSGVFVSNNYKDITLRVWTNNGLQGFPVKFGETAQVITAGLINGDTLRLEAKFYDQSGKYIGHDIAEFYVWYYNGRPFVRSWDPAFVPAYE
jgi:hypothetical protein